MDSDFQHPSDGWYMIEAMGRFPNARANAVQIIDDKACQSIVQNFNKEAAAPGFPGMLIDIEHFKHDDEKETRAYGWLMRLQKRDDGIYGQIRWTNTGRAAVDGGSYRFFSSEFDLRDLENLGEKGGKKLFRPLRLDGLTLTNAPNNAQGQRPITNREPADIANRDHSPKVKAAILSHVASEASAAAKQPPETAGKDQAAADAHAAAVDAHEALGPNADPFAISRHVKQSAQHDARARRLRGQSANTINNRNDDSEAEADFMSDTLANRRALRRRLDETVPLTNRAGADEDPIFPEEEQRAAGQLALETERLLGQNPKLSREYARELVLKARPELGIVANRRDMSACDKAHQRMLVENRRDAGALVEMELSQEDQWALLDQQQQAINGLRRINNRLTYAAAREELMRTHPALFGLVTLSGGECAEIENSDDETGMAILNRRFSEQYDACFQP